MKKSLKSCTIHNLTSHWIHWYFHGVIITFEILTPWKLHMDKYHIYSIWKWILVFNCWNFNIKRESLLLIKFITDCLFSRWPHFVGHIQEVVIKILKEITYQPYLPVMNFHLSDRKTYTTVPCNVWPTKTRHFSPRENKKAYTIKCIFNYMISVLN